jgi:opacity protein-like surface antigen
LFHQNILIKMKKSFFTLFALISLVLGGFAQEKNGIIGISFGPSIPIGDLSSKDSDNASAGWANTGGIFDISFAYKLGKGNFGITALLRGQVNPFDAQAYANELANQLSGVVWTVDTKAWGIGGLMAGGFGSFPVSKKVNFDARTMIGFLTAVSPEITITAIGAGGAAWARQSSATSTSFAYLIGAGFSFDLGNNLKLLSNLDYLGSKPEFRNVETISSDGSRFTDTWSQSMGAINLSVGVGFRF